MRVLIATHGSRSYLYSMVPLAWALRAAGHEVRVAVPPALVDAAADTGLTVVAVGEDHRFEEFANLEMAQQEHDEDDFSLAPDNLRGMLWPDLVWAYDGLVRNWLKAVNDPMLEDLVLLCRQWGPSLVLWEPTTFAGAVAAEACGAAHARFLWSVDLLGSSRTYFLERLAEREPHERQDPLREWLSARAESHGARFGEELVHGRFSITHLPPSLEPSAVAAPESLRLRHIHYGGQTVIPEWLRGTVGDEPEQEAPKRVLVDWRATAAVGASATPVLREVLSGLSTLQDVEVVLVLPEGHGEKPVDLPGVDRTIEQGALHALAPTCSLAVHAGGFDVLCTAGLHGVPQLVLPEPGLYDAGLLTDEIVSAGAGSTIHREDVEAAAVAKEAARLLEDPAVAHGAARLRQEIGATPTPDRLVERIERLTAEHTGGGTPAP